MGRAGLSDRGQRQRHPHPPRRAAQPSDSCAVLVHCRTRLIVAFRERFADRLGFVGNRALLLPLAGPLPEPMLSICLAEALTYKRRGSG